MRGQREQNRAEQLVLQTGDLGESERRAAPSSRASAAHGDARVWPRSHGHPPIGALGLVPQKICVPTMPTRWTITVLSTIDLAVAVPTPTGPPLAV